MKDINSNYFLLSDKVAILTECLVVFACKKFGGSVM